MASRPAYGLKFQAMLLGGAGLIEYALQLLLPIILARSLSTEDFGTYRLVWLLTLTSQVILSVSLPQGLFYFLPRSDGPQRGRLVGNIVLMLAVPALVAVPLWPHVPSALPESMHGLAGLGWMVPAFLSLWLLGAVIETLPTADGRAEYQALITVSLACVRAIALGGVALAAGDIDTMLLAMCFVAVVRLALVPLYTLRYSSFRTLGVDPSAIRMQLGYAIPFAFGNSLFVLRTQADQWVVAALLPTAAFALISVASVVQAMSPLVRQPINNAILPRVSTLLADGNTPGAAELISRAFSTIALALIPAVGALLVTAHEVVDIVYTQKYAAAAPLMQMYLVGLLGGVIASGHLLVAVNRGGWSAMISGVTLLISVSLSYGGIRLFGLSGAVFGYVVSQFISDVISLYVVSGALRCRMTELIDLRLIGRMALSVALSIAATLAWRDALGEEASTFVRFASTLGLYGLVLAIMVFVTGLAPEFVRLVNGRKLTGIAK